MIIFKIFYWAGMIAEIIIRAPYQKNAQTASKTDQRSSQSEQVLLGLMSVFMLLLPLVYSATNWLSFADYSLPAWAGWLSVFLLVCSVLIFARAHTDLKKNWSPTLEIYAEHKLVTSGIYSYIRHPMYASQLLWVLAQPLLLQNWLAGPLDLVFFIPFYLLRVRTEEKMMADTFGEQYAEYVGKTGRLIPKFYA